MIFILNLWVHCSLGGVKYDLWGYDLVTIISRTEASKNWTNNDIKKICKINITLDQYPDSSIKQCSFYIFYIFKCGVNLRFLFILLRHTFLCATGMRFIFGFQWRFYINFVINIDIICYQTHQVKMLLI